MISYNNKEIVSDYLDIIDKNSELEINISKATVKLCRKKEPWLTTKVLFSCGWWDLNPHEVTPARF